MMRRMVDRLITLCVIMLLWSNIGVAVGSDLVITGIQGNLAAMNPNMMPKLGTVVLDEPVSAYAAWIDFCNEGGTSVEFNSANPARHPAICQNLYRLSGGRFEQIAMSWVFHPLTASNFDICDDINGCSAPPNSNPQFFTFLFSGCAQSYSGSFLSSQERSGPRSQVNATTGLAPFPFYSFLVNGNAIFKRLQVRHSDIDPDNHPGARYFIEAIALNVEDGQIGTDGNNYSYREVTIVESSPNNFDLVLTGTTKVGQPAIFGWQFADPSVQIEEVSLAGDGTFYLATKVRNLGNGRWNYEYGLLNRDSQIAASQFRIPLDVSGFAELIGFDDIHYHSGDGNVGGTNFSSADWVISDSTSEINWATSNAIVNPNANALRWGTLYNFRFRANSAPVSSSATITSYRTTGWTTASIATLAPGMALDGACCFADGTCQILTEIECNDAVGVYAGDNETCLDADCPQPGDSRLVLEVANACPGDSNGGSGGDIFEVQLWMRDLTDSATGFQAFLRYDPSLLSYRDDLSSYTPSPFGTHLISIVTSETSPGVIDLDGSSVFVGMPTSADSQLASLFFEILPDADCQSSEIAFRSNLPFKSEVSVDGNPLDTLLIPTPTLTFDDQAPVVNSNPIADCYPTETDAINAAIAAISANDNCTDVGDLSFVANVTGDPCDATVTVLVLDECANETEVTFNTRIDDEDPVLVAPPSDLLVAAPDGTCEAVVTFDDPEFTDNCDPAVSVVCTPPSGSAFPAGITIVECLANDSCGNQSSVTFSVAVTAVPDRMELRIQDQRDCIEEGETICVDLIMTCLDQPVTGFNAFVSFDNTQLEFLPGASSYTNSPFPIHIAAPISANIVGDEGRIDLDGSVIPGNPPVMEEAVLATMCFVVRPGMGGQIYDFEFRPPPAPTINSEYSIDGTPIPTVLSGESTLTPEPRLRIVATTVRECYLPNDEVCVDLEMVCLGEQFVTGFNAFIEFDTNVLEFVSGSYTNSPFPIHLTPIESVFGRITLDGSDNFGGSGTNMEAVLASLCFKIRKSAPGTSTEITFGPPPTPTIDSELSINGVPIPTVLQGTGILTQNTLGLRVCYDDTPPVCVLLETTCLETPISGYRAVVEYDNNALEFLPGLSGYEASPFTEHMNDPFAPNIVGPLATVELDGNVPAMAPLVSDDYVLASLCFNIRPGFEAVGGELNFRQSMTPDESTLLIDADPAPTFLRDSPRFGLAGDINLDGMTDLADIPFFVDVLLNIDTDEERRLISDLNCDGLQNGLDIAAMLELLL